MARKRININSESECNCEEPPGILCNHDLIAFEEAAKVCAGDPSFNHEKSREIAKKIGFPADELRAMTAMFRRKMEEK